MASTYPEIDEKRCLQVLQELIRIKSYSQTPGEIKATEYMHELMTSLGLDSSTPTFDDGQRQNAYGVWKGTGTSSGSTGSKKSKNLLFNGHLDTNPVTEGWTVDPWGGLIKDDMIYGIGVSNMSERDSQC